MDAAAIAKLLGLPAASRVNRRVRKSLFPKQLRRLQPTESWSRPQSNRSREMRKSVPRGMLLRDVATDSGT